MAEVFNVADPPERRASLRAGCEAIAAGELIVLPTDTVYGIGADPFSPNAVMRLLKAKGRGRQSPPPVLIPDLGALSELADDVSPLVSRLGARLWPGALTIVCRAKPELQWDLGDLAGTVALRMPADAIALEFLTKSGPLAVSSANISGQAPAITVTEALRQLGESVAVYLDGGTSAGGVPSTIIDASGERLRVLRAGAVSVEILQELAREFGSELKIETEAS